MLSLRERHAVSLVGAIAVAATSLSLIVCMRSPGYLASTALGVLGLAVLGMLLRQVRAPGVVVMLLQLVVGAIGLCAAYDLPLVAYVVPTADTWPAAVDLLADGSSAARRFTAPTPYNAGLAMMLSLLVLVMGIVVDQLAAGLGRVSTAGLALLALYSVPAAAAENGVGLLGFVPGALAFVALLTCAEAERLARWGRVVDHDGRVGHEDATVSRAPMAIAAARVGVAAVTVAVIGGLVVPVVPAPWSTGGSGTGDGPGGDISFANPLVSLADRLRQSDPEPMLRVQGGSPSYLRMAVLDDPGPDGWQVSTIDLGSALPVGSGLPLPMDVPEGAQVDASSVDVSLLKGYPRDTPWMPVPFGLSETNLPGDFGYLSDSMTVSALGDAVTPGLARPYTYHVEYVDLDYKPWMLRQSQTIPTDIQQRYLQLPSGLPLDVIEEARLVTSGATDPYMRARMLETYFRTDERFSYDVTAAYGSGYEAMSRFLRDGRGFCQQYAATMAMMARAEGIPARVVVGFLHGRRQGGSTVYTTRDLHAWPELYFAGVGWVRFEPTPGNGATAPSWAPLVSDRWDPANDVSPSSSTPTPTSSSSVATPTPTPTPTPESATPARGGDDREWSPPWWVLVPPVALLALGTPAAMRILLRRRRLSQAMTPAAAAEDAWWELRCTWLDLGLSWATVGGETVRHRRDELDRQLTSDEARAAVARLADDVERARFSAGAAGRNLGDTSADAQVVLEEIRRRSPRTRRWRAVLVPRSLLLRRPTARASEPRPRATT